MASEDRRAAPSGPEDVKSKAACNRPQAALAGPEGRRRIIPDPDREQGTALLSPATASGIKKESGSHSIRFPNRRGTPPEFETVLPSPASGAFGYTDEDLRE